MSHTRQPNQTLTSSTQVDSASELSQTSSITQVVTGTLRLRGERLANSTTQQQGEQRASGRRIRWGEDVIDNEGMGKKNSKGKGGFTASLTFPDYQAITCQLFPLLPSFSKISANYNNHEYTVCCIYHKSRALDESSSESDSSSSDTGDSDIDVCHGSARRQCSHEHVDGHHSHSNKCDPEPSSHHPRRSKRKSKRKPSPNAYERVSKNAKRRSEKDHS